MVSIQEATEKAIAFARAALGPERTGGVRLEEVESTKVDGQDAWLITLSMLTRDEDIDVAGMLGLGRREYKTFTVRKSDGEVTSMKMREMANT